MAEIVLIHGIAQEQNSARWLEHRWLPALSEGVRAGGFPEIADRIWQLPALADRIDARMAFYGGLFVRPGTQGAGVEDMSPEQEGLAEQLAREWLERAATRAVQQEQRRIAAIEMEYLQSDPARQVQGVRSAVRAAWKGAARLPWFARLGSAFAERFVVRALSQVSRYLTDDDVRTEIQQIVLDLIKDDTQVIIGHSLGSIVAYEVAHRLDRPLPLLITLGSPLGVGSLVLQRLRPPASFPPRLRRWVNVADRDDLVAAEPYLTNLFAASMHREAVFEGDYTVDNGAEPHGAEFYLGSAHVGRPIGQVFSSAGSRPRVEPSVPTP
jgi:hypothetical protein